MEANRAAQIPERYQGRFLDEKAVAEITGKAIQTLRNERAKGRGIPYLKDGRRVRYWSEDVFNYMFSLRVEREAHAS